MFPMKNLNKHRCFCTSCSKYSECDSGSRVLTFVHSRHVAYLKFFVERKIEWVSTLMNDFYSIYRNFLATNPKQICQHLMMHIFRNRWIELLCQCVCDHEWWSKQYIELKDKLYRLYLVWLFTRSDVYLNRTCYCSANTITDQRFLHTSELYIDIMALPSVIYSRSFP